MRDGESDHSLTPAGPDLVFDQGTLDPNGNHTGYISLVFKVVGGSRHSWPKMGSTQKKFFEIVVFAMSWQVAISVFLKCKFHV